MRKRYIYIGKSAYLSTKLGQLVASFGQDKHGEDIQTPIEDLHTVVIDHPQVTLTSQLLAVLASNNVATIFSDSKHLPVACSLPLDAHYITHRRTIEQLSLTKPTKKRLWQFIIKCKIKAQAVTLEALGFNAMPLRKYVRDVRSGDSTNREGIAAKYYWTKIFNDPSFIRDRYGDYPNNLLNYAYTVLRSATARGLIARGLLPLVGIHHRNKYNSYALADDIMEGYRPIIDYHIAQMVLKSDHEVFTLATSTKAQLLSIMHAPVRFKNITTTMDMAIEETCASIYRAMIGTDKPTYATLLCNH
jgi:CRISPR-associated protein Cas1